MRTQRDKAVDPQVGDVLYIMPQNIEVVGRNKFYVYFTADCDGAFERNGKTRIGDWQNTFLSEMKEL